MRGNVHDALVDGLGGGVHHERVQLSRVHSGVLFFVLGALHHGRRFLLRPDEAAYPVLGHVRPPPRRRAAVALVVLRGRPRHEDALLSPRTRLRQRKDWQRAHLHGGRKGKSVRGQSRGHRSCRREVRARVRLEVSGPRTHARRRIYKFRRNASIHLHFRVTGSFKPRSPDVSSGLNGELERGMRQKENRMRRDQTEI